MVSCDVTGGITLGTKLKMPVFTIYLPHKLTKQGFCVSEVYLPSYVLGIRFQVELTKIFVTKGSLDQEVNPQFDKDLNP